MLLPVTATEDSGQPLQVRVRLVALSAAKIDDGFLGSSPTLKQPDLCRLFDLPNLAQSHVTYGGFMNTLVNFAVKLSLGPLSKT